ncbi:MAG: HDIG domain-containing protein [Candidatus Gastranaerophilales bacterium]|nr:HDIG domain-containing protein [Candidatus Gastranaerophilales bacterium]
MNILKKTYSFIFSSNGLSVLIFLITSILLTFILSGQYYLHRNIIQNSVSKKDIYATKNIKVTDTEKTEKLKAEMVKKVAPTLVPVQDEFIRKKLDKNIDKIKLERSMSIPFSSKTVDLTGYFDINENKGDDIAIVENLITMSDDHFQRMTKITKATLRNILEKGISESDIELNVDKIVQDNITGYASNLDTLTIEFLIKKVIAPNIVVDEIATETSRKNAAQSVRPVEVFFNRGDQIVAAGQIVTKVQKDAIKKCGYNVVQLNFSGILGIYLLVALSLIVIATHLRNFDLRYAKNSYYTLIAVLMIMISAAATLMPSNIIYLLPIPAFTMLVSVFTNPRTAMISSIAALCALSIALQYDVDVSIIFIFGIIFTSFTIGRVDYTRRIDLIRIGMGIGLILVAAITGTFFLEYNLSEITLPIYLSYVSAAFINGIISSIIALGLLPVLESTFKLATPYGLAELANHNQPLLKKLQFEAPGTYHHSLMVASLAEAAAEAVGANPALVKIGAFYHDVGKLKRPLFFIENQSYFGIENPHEKYNPRYSKMVITTHPRDGLEYAKEYNISPAIYPFILQHHGDSVASYFYNQAVKEEGSENVSEEQFRYNAPKPNTKETAILMLADAVESAVRSMKTPTPEEIDSMITKIVNDRLADNQLSESPLTLRDLKTIAATFNRILRGMQHHRIKYHEDILDEIEAKNQKKEDNKNA